MRAITTEIDIRAPLERVWTALTEFDRYPEWNPFIRQASGKPIEGQELHIEMDLGEKGRQRYKVKITSLVLNREFRWLGAFKFPGLIDGDHLFQLESTPTGTRLRHVEHFSGLLVPFVWRSFLLRYLEPSFVKLNRNLKARCEGGALPVRIFDPR